MKRLDNEVTMHPVFGQAVAATLMVLASCASASAAGVTFHVDAQRGDDRAAGTREAPFRSVSRARDAIRAMKKDGRFPVDGVRVELSGIFERATDSISLSAEDGGISPKGRVTYAASEKGASFLGAKRLPQPGWKHVTDEAVLQRLRPEARAKAMEFDLKSVGASRFPPLSARFEAWRNEELYSGTDTLTLARYPDRGWLQIESVLDSGREAGKFPPGKYGKAVRPGSFVYSPDDSFARWDVSQRFYMHGYWSWEWSTESLAVESIDAAKREVRLAGIHRYGIGNPNPKYTIKRRYYVYNLLEEMNEPGEWYIDRQKAILYAIPRAEGLGDMKLAVRQTPLLSIKGARHVTVDGVKFLYGISRFAHVKDAEDVTVSCCEIAYGSNGGIFIDGGRRCEVRSCSIHDLGFFGARLVGGDRRTLTPSGHRITGCDIHHAGRRVMNGGVCIGMGGCGGRVDHNYMHDMPYIALSYGGNEHVIEFNEVAFAMMEAADGGGIYTGRDWGSQGNVLRCNYLHHFGAAGLEWKRAHGEKIEFEPVKVGGHGMLMGIYLDDCASGDTVTNNLFFAAGCGLFVGGGRDNKMRDNLVMDFLNAAYVDARGVWAIDDRPGLDPDANNGFNMLAKIERWDYTNEPWASRYPALAKIRENKPKWPMGTEFTGNVAVGCGAFMQPKCFGTTPKAEGIVAIRDNIELPADLLDGTDPKAVQDLPEFRRAAPRFPRIPVENIGPAGRR